MKKIICFVLIIIMVSSPVSVRASSAVASLEIFGGLASGGLSGGASSTTFAVALTLMVMSALGMQVKLTEQAKAAGETAQTYIENMYAKWVGGTSVKELTESQREELKKRFKVISTGGSDNKGDSNNKVNKNGKIYLAAGALALIQKFLNWLNSRNEIINPELLTPSIVNGTYYGISCNAITTEGNTATCTSYVNNQIDKVCWIKAKVGDYYKVCLYHAGNRYTVENDFGFGGYHSSSDNGYGYNICDGTFSEITTPGLLDISELGWGDNFSGYLKSLGTGSMIPDNNVSQENYIEGEYNSSQLDNPNNGYTVLDPALFNQLLNNIDAGTQAQLSIEEYIKAIMDQLNKQSNPEAVPQAETVPVVNPTDLSPMPQPLPDPEPDPVPGTFPSDEPAPGDNDPPPDSDPVNDPDPAPPDVAVPKMMIPLDEYFPFCIPFDVYHLLQKLSADPVAPSYTIGFTVYGTEVNYTISLDAFSGAMVIVRRMELFVCVIGLAIASRKIFTR